MTPTSVDIPVQPLLDRTTDRLLMREDVKFDTSICDTSGDAPLQAELHFKWGGDGASDQALYKMGFGSGQTDEQTNDNSHNSSNSEDEDEAEQSSAGGNATNRASDSHVWTVTAVPLGLRIGTTWVIIIHKNSLM